MSCPTSIVPGLDASSKAIKGADPALEAKIGQEISHRDKQRDVGVLSYSERDALVHKSIRGGYKNLAHLESKVRNMPLSHYDTTSTRKGDAVTDSLIWRLREEEASGKITPEDRKRALNEEIESNQRVWDKFSKRDFGLMGYG